MGYSLYCIQAESQAATARTASVVGLLSSGPEERGLGDGEGSAFLEPFWTSLVSGEVRVKWDGASTFL